MRRHVIHRGLLFRAVQRTGAASAGLLRPETVTWPARARTSKQTLKRNPAR